MDDTLDTGDLLALSVDRGRNRGETTSTRAVYATEVRSRSCGCIRDLIIEHYQSNDQLDFIPSDSSF